MRFKRLLLIVVLCLLSAGVSSARTPRYVFYIMGDGMGINQVHMTQGYNEALGLPSVPYLDFPVFTMITTRSASSLVTDSAAAGTALATGSKTRNGSLGVDRDGGRLVNIMELAHAKGFGTGVVTSVGVNHASPAAFYAHVGGRHEYTEITRQLTEDSVVDFAAGATILTQRGDSHDAAYYVQQAREKGMRVFCGKSEYTKAGKGERVLYLSERLDRKSLSYAIDRTEVDMTLADFTSAAIDYLASNFAKGFVLFIEGGKIDHACHSRDAGNCVHETNDLSESVRLALDFYDRHPDETLIIVTADHETGGLIMTSGKYELHPELLAGQNCSLESLTRQISGLRNSGEEVSWSSLKSLLGARTGLWNGVAVKPADEKELTQSYKESFLDMDGTVEKNLYSANERVAAESLRLLAREAGYTWGTSSHSGTAVPLFVKGAKAGEFVSCRDNTDVAKVVKKVAKF